MSNAAMLDKKTEEMLSKMGLKRSGAAKWPFLPFKDEVGALVAGKLLDSRDVTFIPKKGKNKGKKQETVYFTIEVSESNIKGVTKGARYTISPTGLLEWQLTEGLQKAGHSIPCDVAIRYLGKDDEDRHQTEVFYPKSK